jgi:hypothetical protein
MAQLRLGASRAIGPLAKAKVPTRAPPVVFRKVRRDSDVDGMTNLPMESNREDTASGSDLAVGDVSPRRRHGGI